MDDINLNPHKLTLTCAVCGAQDLTEGFEEYDPVHAWSVGCGGKPTCVVGGFTTLCEKHADYDQLAVAKYILSNLPGAQDE